MPSGVWDAMNDQYDWTALLKKAIRQGQGFGFARYRVRPGVHGMAWEATGRYALSYELGPRVMADLSKVREER